MTISETSSPPRAPNILAPLAPARTPSTKFPKNSCDCHAHVFGNQEKYPLRSDATYIPHVSPVEDYIHMLESIGCDRAVLVQPSGYGADNRCLVDTLNSGLFDFRGVAVVDPAVTAAEIEALHRVGVRGIRINTTSSASAISLRDAGEMARLILPYGWHIQFYIEPSHIEEVAATVKRLPVNCVIDHFAQIDADQVPQPPAFRTLMEMSLWDNVWFKLTGGYRVSHEPPPYPRVKDFVQALLVNAADRCVWGSDWPHPLVSRMDDDAAIADALGFWVEDEHIRNTILVTNPARLYDFSTNR
ncbi:MAG TPA: amidohydrolase family protein [Bordetella sp.]